MSETNDVPMTSGVFFRIFQFLKPTQHIVLHLAL